MARQRGTVGTAVLLGLLVLAVAGRADEAAAVRMVEKLGGDVTRDDEIAGNPVVGVHLDETAVTDEGLKQLKELKSLQTLVLRHTKVTDAGLKELKERKSLQVSQLGRTQANEEGR